MGRNSITILTLLGISFIASCDKDVKPIPLEAIQIISAQVGTSSLNLSDGSQNINNPKDKPIVIRFSTILNVNTVEASIKLQSKTEGTAIPVDFFFLDNNKTISVTPVAPLTGNKSYLLTIAPTLAGSKEQEFAGAVIEFKTVPETLIISALDINGIDGLNIARPINISRNPSIQISFSAAIQPNYANINYFRLFGPSNTVSADYSLSNNNTTLTITATQSLRDLARHQIWISSSLRGVNDEIFAGLTKYFYTEFDANPKFPIITDNELLTKVQQQTFKFFYDYGEPNSGMARERNGSNELVTTGGTGFGLMAMVVAMERNFITRQQGIDRLTKIVSFLEKADRFHGAWSHWVNGSTGKVIPFSTKDNGGDLVETSFLVQGLLTCRQYLQPADTVGNNLIKRITKLWEGVEWDWYRKDNSNVLYWHWSPNYNWDMNFALSGYFEQQITYVLAAASPTHSIPKTVYSNGYGQNGGIVKNNTYYGYTLPLGGLVPLFWTQYSYLGLDPHFSDDYANYWTQNTNASLINQAYCIANPKQFVGYSESCWGLTASDNQSGYNAHSPSNDLGVITPTAALSAFPYTPDASMKALKFFYYTLGDRLWGDYGFYDAFNITEGWTASSYLAIDQGPIIVMIENYRTGLLWDLFMSSPEIETAKTKLGLIY